MRKFSNEFSGKNFSEFKEKLSEELVDKINPISNEIKKLISEKDYLDKIQVMAVKKRMNMHLKKLKKIHEIIGFKKIY